MTRINLTKYGFVRWQEEDFSDDGNRFTCYKVGKRVRVSKLISHGDAFISARIDDCKLPYEIYSKLPCYRDLDALNGVSLSSITEADLQKLYEDCLTYEAEYDKALSEIHWPTMNEINEKRIELYKAYVIRFNRIEALLQEHVVDLTIKSSTYDWGRIKDHLRLLKKRVEDFANPESVLRLYQSPSSFDYVKKDAEKIAEDDYYYQALIETIDKYCY